MGKQKSKKKNRFIIVLCVVAVIMIIGDWVLSVTVYNENFNKRFESYEPLMLCVNDFDGLQRTQYEFSSDQGQKLTGYMYSSGENQHGIVVMAHGFGGGGHNSYMDCASFFAHNGYYVFTYDATGNDESEGEGVGGTPQGVVDLDYAISYVEESGIFPDLPIVLFGHSWGGYSVCSVLTYHPEVKAVIACSGFNSSSDMFEAEGKKQAGYGIYLMMPFVKLHERIKYGDYAANTAMDGFLKSEADVLIVHSADDDIVPIEYGFDIYYEKYKDDPRFSFIRLEDKGHNYVYNDMTYINEFNAEFDKWIETLDYDYNAKENQERFSEDKAEYIHNNLDRDKWCDMLNAELFESFVSFYDEHLTSA
ncbi:MAG: alpha/beta fold hydrolase [Lachnospiraceae bacterium]|nr:alpha/beta fold hydrolase [Lachnospiraceae bacterium]